MQNGRKDDEQAADEEDGSEQPASPQQSPPNQVDDRDDDLADIDETPAAAESAEGPNRGAATAMGADGAEV